MAISKPRNRVVLFRLTQDEFHEVQQACSTGGARSVSDYARARIVGAAPPNPASLTHIETRLADLTRAVEHLTRLIEGTPKAEAASANYGSAHYLAKSGD